MVLCRRIISLAAQFVPYARPGYAATVGNMIGFGLLILPVVLGADAAQSEKRAAIELSLRREYHCAAAELERNAQHFFAKGTAFRRYIVGDVVVTKDLTVAASGDKKLLSWTVGPAGRHHRRRTFPWRFIARRPNTCCSA